MKALVATVKYLLLIDLAINKVQVLEANRPEYYGISWWENNESLVLSHSSIANDSLIDMESYINSEKGYLSFNNIETHPFLSQPHQIICAPDNIIIATNTGRNCVTLFDINTHFHKNIRVNDIHWDRLSKENTCGEHFNSVFLKENRFLYVMAHRFRKSSHILKYSYPDCQLVERYEMSHRFGLHNIWADNNDNLIACNSDGGELLDIKTNETLWSSGTTTYSRGLAATKDIILVGGSDIVSREHRNNSLTKLWIIDRKTYTTTDCLEIGNFGSVHEVRILDEPDEAHHGILFKGLHALEKCSSSQIKQPVASTANTINMTEVKNTNIGLLQPFSTIINGLTVTDEKWLRSKNNGFCLSLVKHPPTKTPVIMSLNYRFIPGIETQFVGITLGYKGPEDTNMVCVLILHNSSVNHTEVCLWKNDGNEWKSICNLLPQIDQEGTLSITKEDNLLIVKSRLMEIQHTFEANELEGNIGIRVFQGEFSDFTIQPVNTEASSYNRSWPNKVMSFLTKV